MGHSLKRWTLCVPSNSEYSGKSVIVLITFQFLYLNFLSFCKSLQLSILIAEDIKVVNYMEALNNLVYLELYGSTFELD